MKRLMRCYPKLKENSEQRHAKLKEIWNNPESQNESEIADSKADDRMAEPELEDMSEWEKKIEAQSKQSDEKPKEEEPKKKKVSLGERKSSYKLLGDFSPIFVCFNFLFL